MDTPIGGRHVLSILNGRGHEGHVHSMSIMSIPLFALELACENQIGYRLRLCFYNQLQAHCLRLAAADLPNYNGNWPLPKRSKA